MRADCFIVWLGVYVNVFQSMFVDVYCRSNSPLKRAGVDENPCSRVTVLSALKESRKRSFAVFDEGEEEVSRPSKRCVVNCAMYTTFTCYILTSICIFSILFSIHFLRCSRRICVTIKSFFSW